MSYRVAALLASACALTACEPTQKSEQPSDVRASPTEAPPLQSEPSAADIVVAPKGAVQEIVASAQREAAREGRRVVVYVGADWCEPCQYFLDSVKTKSLPKSLWAIRFLKFDHDVDEARLEAGGYGGPMLPRFVLPASDGSATERRFEGSTKGPQAIDNIVPRLEAMVGPGL